LREVNSLNDIRSNRSALLHNIKAEIEGTNRSGFRESGSLAFEKAIFDLNYRKQVFTDAFGDNDDQALLEVLVGGRALTELNQIFYGPPGTGKTFHTINAAIEIIDPFLYRNKGGDRAALQKRFQELRISEGEHKEGQIGFTTFHQSMSYEDFIEGIKPSSPKEGDSYLKYDVEEGIFKKMCRLAAANEEKNYVLIIDEINRGNVSAIFGELITLVEPNKRAGAEESLGIVLPYSKAIFSVPKNLHIIGTMNTADRSVEALDSALRRRFAFKEMAPDPDVIAAHGKLAENNGVLEEGRLKVNLPELLKTINGRIELLRDKDCLIGHSYLMEVKTLEDLRRAFLDKIIPLLQEYFFADLGKLSLILGPSFVEVVNDKEVSFAKGHDYDQLLVNELQERKVYRLTSPDIWDFEQILA
jgi:5-methylcytosine-specific restriction protein B